MSNCNKICMPYDDYLASSSAFELLAVYDNIGGCADCVCYESSSSSATPGYVCATPKFTHLTAIDITSLPAPIVGAAEQNINDTNIPMFKYFNMTYPVYVYTGIGAAEIAIPEHVTRVLEVFPDGAVALQTVELDQTIPNTNKKLLGLNAPWIKPTTQTIAKTGIQYPVLGGEQGGEQGGEGEFYGVSFDGITAVAPIDIDQIPTTNTDIIVYRVNSTVYFQNNATLSLYNPQIDPSKNPALVLLKHDPSTNKVIYENITTTSSVSSITGVASQLGVFVVLTENAIDLDFLTKQNCTFNVSFDLLYDCLETQKSGNFTTTHENNTTRFIATSCGCYPPTSTNVSKINIARATITTAKTIICDKLKAIYDLNIPQLVSAVQNLSQDIVGGIGGEENLTPIEKVIKQNQLTAAQTALAAAETFKENAEIDVAAAIASALTAAKTIRTTIVDMNTEKTCPPGTALDAATCECVSQ